VFIDKSGYFVRDGLDVHSEADVSVAQALLGGKLRVRGLFEDKVSLEFQQEQPFALRLSKALKKLCKGLFTRTMFFRVSDATAASYTAQK
jgi:hypothetical protein